MAPPIALQELPGFDIDPSRGFLPADDPLERLPPSHRPWDELAAALPALLPRRRVRAAVADLPMLDPAHLETPAELRRAMLVLSVLGNAYVWESTPAAARIPRQLAEPWSRVAERCGRPPIAAHASMVLANWRRRDPYGPLALENLDTLATFYDLEDERWFYLVTVALEARGAAAIPVMLAAQAAVARDDPGPLATHLTALAGIIAAVAAVMDRMYEHCRPAEFYRYVRPVLTGWPEPGVVYEGVGEIPRVLIGGSAAQSSLIQAFDAFLGVSHPSPASGPFLAAMRGYMPPPHRRFLERLEAGPSVRQLVRSGSRTDLADARRGYQACLHALELFRKQHLGLAARYIAQPAGEDPTVRGTGGTDFAAFLNAARRETREAQNGIRPFD